MSLWQVAGYCVLSGVLFSLLGVVYRLAENHRIPAPLVLTLASTVGCAVFGAAAGRAFLAVPWWFLGLALATGLLQYLLVVLNRIALRLGPLSPLWCALMLNFVPVILFFWIFFDEPVSGWSAASIAAALVAVLCAAASAEEPARSTAGAKPGRGRRRLGYALVLLAVLTVNSQASVVNKFLSLKFDNFLSLAPVYLSLLYFGIALPGWIAVAAHPVRGIARRTLLPLAAVGTLGTMGGLFVQNLVIQAPPALVFTVICSSSILSGAVLSVVICRERRTPVWYATLLFALAAIVTSQGGALLKLLR